MKLEEIANNPELLEIGRKAIESHLIELRNSRIALMGRANGLVIREMDGSNSNLIRMGPETALKVGLKAIAEHLEKQDSSIEDNDFYEVRFYDGDKLCDTKAFHNLEEATKCGMLGLESCKWTKITVTFHNEELWKWVAKRQ